MTDDNKPKDEKRWREFWINDYGATHSVFDCVAHTTLERCNDDAVKSDIKKQAIHVVEIAALTEAEAKLAKRDADETTAYLVGHAKGKEEAEAEIEKLHIGSQKQTELLLRDSEIIRELEAALTEARMHFNSIRSGLTTEIKQVEPLTKRLAQGAHIEVTKALEKLAKFRKKGAE